MPRLYHSVKTPHAAEALERGYLDPGKYRSKQIWFSPSSNREMYAQMGMAYRPNQDWTEFAVDVPSNQLRRVSGSWRSSDMAATSLVTRKRVPVTRRNLTEGEVHVRAYTRRRPS